jgi:arabinan endo-1,5-alpha-L-arabinosidase
MSFTAIVAMPLLAIAMAGSVLLAAQPPASQPVNQSAAARLPSGTLVEAGPFVKIYDPSVGETGQWYINDHCFAYGPDGTWHMIGITGKEHQAPTAEIDLAHASAKTLLQQPWDKLPTALSRATETPWKEGHLWAPHIVLFEGVYYMYYCAGGPHPAYKIHLATSTDLKTWTRHPQNPMVVDGFDARDPNVTRIGDQWVMYYTATSQPEKGDHVVSCATSTDLLTWTRRGVVFNDMDGPDGTYGGATESPFVVQRGKYFYLFIGPRKGVYDVTEVFVSLDPFHWNKQDRVGRIAAHAAEVVRDLDGKWYVSRCGWGRGGVYLAPLTWKDGLDDAETNIAAPRKPATATK